MKKLISTLRISLIFICICFGLNVLAEQVLITVNFRNGQAGNLEKALILAGYDTDEKLNEITDLKVITEGTYEYNNRDFDIALETSDFTFLNTKLTSLEKLDLSDALVTNNYGDGRGPSNSFPNDIFKNNAVIKTISLPITLVGIGSGAFVNTALEGKIIIPKGVNGAANLDYTRFGNTQGISAFIASEESAHITTIDGVVFSKDMTELHYYPSGKTDESYVIPEGVVTIRNNAFEHNHYLKYLTLASTTTTMQAGANRFDVIGNHSELIESVFVASGNEVFGSSNGVLYQLEGNRAVWSPRGKKELILSAPIQRIAGGGSQNSMFGGNGSNSTTGENISNNYTKVITLADFPETLEWVENGAFVAADSLAIVISRATTVPVNEQNAFRTIGEKLSPPWSTKVFVPAASLESYKTSTWVDNSQGPNPTASGSTITFKGFNVNNFFAFYNLDLTGATAVSSIATDIAVENDEVTITAAQAPEGKVFKGWNSTTPGVVFADSKATATTFTMPASDVTIEAVFDTEYTIEVTNGTAAIAGKIVEKAFAGEVITVTAGTVEGKLFTNWTSEIAGVEFDDADDAVTTFTMPASNVTVEAEFETAYTIDVTGGAAYIEETVVTEVLAGSTITVKANTIEDKVFKNWTTETPGVEFADADEATTTFSMPAGNVEITAVFEDLIAYTILDAVTSSGKATEGTVVNIEAEAIKGGNQIFQNWEVVEGAEVVIADPEAASTSFTMLDAPVTIKAIYKTIYSISVTGGTAAVSENPVEKAYAGELITITAVVPDGQSFVKWTSASNVVFANEDNEETTFEMPANNVEITAEFKANGPNSLENIQANELSLYLNPAHEYINLQVAENTTYALYSNTGQLVMKGITDGKIDVNELPAGLYIIQVNGQSSCFVKQ